MTWKDETTIARVIEALKAMYHDMQEHMGVKHSYLNMSLNMSENGVCSITMPVFIAEVLMGIELRSAATPTSGTLFMTNESSPALVDKTRRKRSHVGWDRYCI